MPDQPTTGWVVELVFPDLEGFTLWGPAGDGEDDRVLTRHGEAVLFATEASLTASLRDAEGVGALEAGGRYDLVEVAGSLALPPERWDLGRCSAVVDGINMLGDIAASVGLDAIVDAWAHGAIGAVVDALTFVTADAVAETVAQVEPRAVLGRYLADLAAVTARTRRVD